MKRVGHSSVQRLKVHFMEKVFEKAGDRLRVTYGSRPYLPNSYVDDFVAVKAHDFNKAQQTSISRQQQVPQQSLGINKIQQISISSGIWFGTRGSEVQILSPRPIQIKYLQILEEWARSKDFHKRTYIGASAFCVGMNSRHTVAAAILTASTRSSHHVLL